jgi:hypothetical protein
MSVRIMVYPTPMWTCTNDHWVCERLHGFYYGCTDSFIRLAVNNGYLKFGVVGDSVTVSYCTVYSQRQYSKYSRLRGRLRS